MSGASSASTASRAIALGVIKQATANPLDVAQEVQQILPSISESCRRGWKSDVANDKSVFIAESIKNVYHTIGEAIVLVVLIIFLFLRSIRATLIPLVTIPGVADRRLRADVRSSASPSTR